jgi:hypothetical protein
MELYRIPRREVSVRILLDDGRTLDGTLFTAESAAGGRSEDVLQLLNGTDVEFVPLLSGKDSFLLSKAGVIWVQLMGEPAREIALEAESGRRVPVRFSLAGGVSVVGTVSIVMPPERSRVVDYLNAAGRFLPLFGEGIVTLVQRRFIVTVRSGEGGERI